MEEDQVCCKALEELGNLYPGTFFRPRTYDSRWKSRLLGWRIKVYLLTPMGEVTDEGSTSLLINFCPICGKQLNGACGEGPKKEGEK